MAVQVTQCLAVPFNLNGQSTSGTFHGYVTIVQDSRSPTLALLNLQAPRGGRARGGVDYGGTILQAIPKVPVRVGQKSPVTTSTV